ncbi:hypothetical protein [Hyphomicrobium sp.]|jgi:hypothetical protein|uniref:hypothetical protein n=1 Tax=Hyphomicrobium sp. TaxID=82 RepID=UPI0035637661
MPDVAGTAHTMTSSFIYFKRSGKYYSEGNGVITNPQFESTRETLLKINGGAMPELNSSGAEFFIVLLPPQGFPMLLPPIDEIALDHSI